MVPPPSEGHAPRVGANPTLPDLDTGLGDKLRAAAARLGNHTIPSARGPSIGKQFRFLAIQAGFGPDEMLALAVWLEDAYDEATSDKFTTELMARRPRSSR